jgi:hypothetical protein
MCRLARVFATIAFLAAAANELAAGESHVSLVPWEVVVSGEVVDSPLVLFWIPATTEELRRSELLESEELTLFSSRCVAMRVVRVDDRARLAKLDVGANVPMVVLAERDGTIRGRIVSEGGEVPLYAVEELVRDELSRRESEAEALLDRARELFAEQQVAAAVAIYDEVWEQRCVCPRQGKDARRALKKLGRK